MTLYTSSRTTNVGDVYLARTTGGWAAEVAWATKLATAVWASAMASTRGSWIAEARLGLSIFSNVDEASHEVLIAERCDGVLSLVPSRIFHDATSLHPSKSRQPPSVSRTNHQSISRTITFDIPFGSSNTSANKTSPAVEGVSLVKACHARRAQAYLVS